jgi:uncharacterized protein YdaT
MKNFPAKAKAFGVKIANGILRDTGDEGKAIRIATAKAKAKFGIK